MKRNCWEYKSCGREPMGKKAGEMGICPATQEAKLHGVHDGLNAGRACWAVAGTFCEGSVQGTFAQKFDGCKVCDFYSLVKDEEKEKYQLTILLLNKMKSFK